MVTAEMIKDQENLDQVNKNILLVQNCLKAYAYLITWFLSDYSKARNNQKKEIGVSKRRRKNAVKDDAEMEHDAIGNYMREALTLLGNFIDFEMQVFFAGHKVDEDVVKAYMRSGFDIVECQANLKNLELKTAVFELLEKCLRNYKDQLRYIMGQNSQKIINLLYSQEGMAKPLSEFVGSVTTANQENILANEIIKDLTKQIFHNDSQHDSVGLKNVAKFLQKLSKHCPKIVYQNIGNLLGFFDCEAYVLRQSLIKILFNMIKFLCPTEAE